MLRNLLTKQTLVKGGKTLGGYTVQRRRYGHQSDRVATRRSIRMNGVWAVGVKCGLEARTVVRLDVR